MCIAAMNTMPELERKDRRLPGAADGLDHAADYDPTYSGLDARSIESKRLLGVPNRKLGLGRNKFEFLPSDCLKYEMDRKKMHSHFRSSLIEQGVKTVTPVIDIKFVPKIPSQDEPVKLNVIKGTTSYKQIVNHIAKRATKEKGPKSSLAASKNSNTTVKKNALSQFESFTNPEDNESVDSSTLIPEGHPGGWNAGDKNGIYLSWTSIAKPQKVKACSVHYHYFSLKSH